MKKCLIGLRDLITMRLKLRLLSSPSDSKFLTAPESPQTKSPVFEIQVFEARILGREFNTLKAQAFVFIATVILLDRVKRTGKFVRSRRVECPVE